MFNKKYTDEYQEIIEKDPEGYGKDFALYQEKIANSKAMYMGEPVPGLYQGIFYDLETKKSWSNIADTIMGISKKIVDEYLKNPEYRKLFGYSKEMEDIILHDPGYDEPIPMGRFDIFYEDKGNFWFCEFNTDGSSAMNEDNALGEILLQTKGMQEFQKKYNLKSNDYFNPWVEKTIALYESMKGEKPKTVAIVDFTESGTPIEFEEFALRYENYGVQAFVADLRDLTFEDGKLMYEGTAIDLVYRRVTTAELLEKKDLAKAFIDAYYANAFVCVGSMRSQVVHNKIVFYVMHHEKTKKILTDEENDFIAKHVPFTASLTPEVAEHVKQNKDRYILKPEDSRGSDRVFVGADYSQERFEEIVDELIQIPAIYQQFITAEPMDFVFFEDGQYCGIKPMVCLFGMFIYFSEFIGTYTRVGAERIISSKTSYYVPPHLEITEKKE